MHHAQKLEIGIHISDAITHLPPQFLLNNFLQTTNYDGPKLNHGALFVTVSVLSSKLYEL